MRVLSAIVGVLMCVAVMAQPADREAEFLLDLQVNYDGNYREGTWVPVDVLVTNDREDLEGFVEVRTYTGDQLQSPIYTTPAESPRSSQKRFRFYVKLSGATRIEANFISNGQRVLNVSPYQNLRPTDSFSEYAMLLTEDPADFGFLNTLLNRVPTDVNQRDFRLYRKRITTSNADLLPEVIQCYETYDFVVVQEFESGRIGPSQRELLERYVKGGGVVLFMLGEHAQLHRGTWVEEFAGVSIGSTEIVPEREVAARVFDDDERTCAHEAREIYFTELTPQGEDVIAKGEDAVIGTLRPMGSGYVATTAVDATSRAFQDCEGYLAMWTDVLKHEPHRDRFDYGSAAYYLQSALPQMAGIQLFSKRSVMAYLALYLGVGIIANWLFWNFLKRREYAWVCMVIFSIAFTSYALIFGTAGRATASEVERIEIVRLPQGSSEGTLHSFLGILTARTNRYDITLPDDETLVQDITTMSATSQRYGQNVATRPFDFVQGANPAVESLAIGASEMRLVKFEEPVTVDGAVVSELTFDDLQVTGALRNETGIGLQQGATGGYLVARGHVYAANTKGDVIEPERLPGTSLEQFLHSHGNAMPYGGMSEDIGRQLSVQLLMSYANSGGSLHGRPLFIGWGSGATAGNTTINAEGVNENINQTLLIAEVADQSSERLKKIRRDVPFNAEGESGFHRTARVGEVEYVSPGGANPDSRDVTFMMRPYTLNANSVVHLIIYLPESAQSPMFIPTGAGEAWHLEHLIAERESDDGTMVLEYAIDDWSDRLFPTSSEEHRRAKEMTMNLTLAWDIAVPDEVRFWKGTIQTAEWDRERRFGLEVYVEFPVEAPEEGWQAWR